MPVFTEPVDHAFSPRSIELINWRAGRETLTATGGPLFSTRMRAAAVRATGTSGPTPTPSLQAGRFPCRRPRRRTGGPGQPARERLGLLADRGATIIQTDEPKAATNWLAANGFSRALCRRGSAG